MAVVGSQVGLYVGSVLGHLDGRTLGELGMKVGSVEGIEVLGNALEGIEVGVLVILQLGALLGLILGIEVGISEVGARVEG